MGPLWFPRREDKGLSLFLSRSVIGQQLSTHAARSIWARIEAVANASDRNASAFFCRENVEQLRACGVSSNKIKALLSIREADCAGHFDKYELRRMEHAERVAHLSQIWGIGPWTCDMASIFYFKNADVWPDGDISVTRALARYLGPSRVRASRLNRIAAEFSPHRSILALYMWHIIDR